ncbi:unnamed protein product [Linum tenue]|nr:unnamed protein product [Linum tenue]
MSINLQISRPLQTLNPQIIDANQEETLIFCAQFLLHGLNNNNPDERTKFSKTLRRLEPKAVILSENNMDCSCNGCMDSGWSFLKRWSPVVISGLDELGHQREGERGEEDDGR